ncbi:MAG: hypothetical protein QXU40_04180 [Candidatus Pacearchaeota archaeon]
MKREFSNLLLIIVIILGLSITACKKKDDHNHDTPAPQLPGEAEIHLENRVGNLRFYFNEPYVTENGDTIQFTMFNYYVSNFQFIKEDGSLYTVPKDSCYFLVKGDDSESQELHFHNIPAGKYKGVKFIIGVDSLMSASPIEVREKVRGGVLDPATGAQGMYWSWNTGYIFVKAEGKFKPHPDSAQKDFKYHIGLFGGYSSPTINNIKTVELMFNQNVEINSNRKPNIHCYVNPLELFKTPTTFDIKAQPVIMASPASKTIADNYADMIKFDHIH